MPFASFGESGRYGSYNLIYSTYASTLVTSLIFTLIVHFVGVFVVRVIGQLILRRWNVFDTYYIGNVSVRSRHWDLPNVVFNSLEIFRCRDNKDAVFEIRRELFNVDRCVQAETLQKFARVATAFADFFAPSRY